MGKISQSDAQTAARKIVEPINKKMIEIEQQIREKVTGYAQATVPADVMKVFKGDNCEYIQTANSVNLYENGFNGRNVTLVGNVPMLKGGYYNTPKLNLTKVQADAIHKLDEKKDKLREKYETTKSEVEASILTLGTHKRVQEEFPEAYGMLPGINTNTGLSVQLQPVREKVKCLISEDQEKKCIDRL